MLSFNLQSFMVVRTSPFLTFPLRAMDMSHLSRLTVILLCVEVILRATTHVPAWCLILWKHLHHHGLGGTM